MRKNKVRTVQQIQQLKKDKFIDAYQKTNGNITDSASIAEIDRGTYYNWLENDKEFAMKILDSEANLNDEIRQVLINKAAEGDMTAVIFYLKNRHPDFKPQPNVLIQQNFNQTLQNERKEFDI
jgi:hypothetical protein